ncbi:hypothetical protein MMC07_009815, partial [Pseudocyphellaria aurata]|nr:hypothetical protein [Pseudocyphellaria aurata]
MVLCEGTTDFQESSKERHIASSSQPLKQRSGLLGVSMDGQSNGSQPIGGLPPPPGVTPNFVDPYSLRRFFILTFVMCVTVTTIFILVRAYTKTYIIKAHEWEDYISYLAWTGFICHFGFQFEAFKYGTGVHQWNVTAENVIRVGKAASAIEALYVLLIFVTKLSILLQYMRIFVPARAGVRYYLIHTLIWLNLVYYIINFFLGLFFCTPRRKIWDPSVPGHCLSLGASVTSIMSAAALNVLSDVTILVLPIFWISVLQMPLRRKVAVSMVFAMGICACVASIMRLILSVKFVTPSRLTPDVTYDLVPLLLLSDAEVAIGIICGCMPVTPRFLRHFFPIIKARLLSSRDDDKGNGFLPMAAVAAAKVKGRPVRDGGFMELGGSGEEEEERKIGE